MIESNYHIHKLKEYLSVKQRKNPSYSLRALSRDLSISPSTLSQILKGKRSIPKKRLKDICNKLELSPKEFTLFAESFQRSKTNIDDIKISKIDQRFMLDESYYRVIAEWEHYAVLELFKLSDFQVSEERISTKLGISENRAEVVINNLLACGLINQGTEGELIASHPDIKTTEDISNNALKASHKETMEIGVDKLNELSVELRDFSSTTLAVDMDKIDDAKTIIREFRQKMTALLSKGNKSEVFQLAIQFYPLSNMESVKEKK